MRRSLSEEAILKFDAMLSIETSIHYAAKPNNRLLRAQHI
jgi:hypothetical protein